MGKNTFTQGILLCTYFALSKILYLVLLLLLVCDVCCSYITEQGIPVSDQEQDGTLIDVYTNQTTSLVYVTFTRPLETSDDEDLDRPLYLYYGYGTFDTTSPVSPVGPPDNLLVSTVPIRFDCERKSIL